MKIKKLHEQYLALEHDARRLQRNVIEQIEHLLSKNGVALGVPLETRIKDWNSIGEKIERKSLQIDDVRALDDLIGIRVILLFKKDTETVCKLLKDTFDVVGDEDAGSRLGDAQFGYHSKHYIIRFPEKWGQIPTFAGLEGFRCEVQIRSLAQHIWAAASHKLQYKREISVPPPLRRTINRISALLETVDLEFDRILEERKAYVDEAVATNSPDELLNVDIIESILDELLPAENKDTDEDYDEILKNLTHFGITSAKQLRDLVTRHSKEALENDEREVASRKHSRNYLGTSKERNDLGVFYTHVGLAREVLGLQFGNSLVQKHLVDMQRKKVKRK